MALSAKSLSKSMFKLVEQEFNGSSVEENQSSALLGVHIPGSSITIPNLFTGTINKLLASFFKLESWKLSYSECIWIISPSRDD